MSTFRPPSKVTKRKELRQDQVVTFYAKAWDFFEKNRALVYGLLAVLVLVIAGLVFMVINQGRQAQVAQEMLAEVISVYEAGNYEAALQGTPTEAGLLEIADEYGGSDAGNMAAFYAANALYTIGETERALEYFSTFDKDENFVGASAYAGMAAANEDLGEFERAGELYRTAALFYENEVGSPQYLIQAGRAFQEAAAYDEAREVYETLQEEFPESQEAEGVPFHLTYLSALQQGSQ